MSGSAMADAFVTMLTAPSVFGPGAVTIGDYSVLEKVTGSCAIVNFAGVGSRDQTFGGAKVRVWRWQVDGYAKGQADDRILAMRGISVVDAIVACLEKDSTLQGTSFKTDAVDVTHTPGVLLEIGGNYWLPAGTVNVEAEELPDG